MSRIAFIPVVCLAVWCANVNAAPLPPEKPATISGTIVSADWTPATPRKARPGFSGSLGVDVVVPAHFRVVLKDYDGVSSTTAKRISFYVTEHAAEDSAQSRVALQLNHKDREFLQPGMRIRVRNYHIAGDEGGTWTKYDKIEILASKPPAKPR